MPPRRVLVIDDEPAVANGCRLVLSEAGYDVDVCRDGVSGRDAILKNDYDAALLDMRLPDLDGLKILEAVRAKRPEIYVIVMTGHSSVRNAVEAMKAGAFDYLAKPFSDDELLLAVGRVLEKKNLVEENAALKKRIVEQYDFSNIIGENPRIVEIFRNIEKVAPTDATVLLGGESGTGKELFARAIHARSQRSHRRFVAIDCGTFSTGLLESELFGHVKGAFTGAIQDKAGIFELASEGSLFLDEAGNLSHDIQGKLLRVLESGEFKPVGGEKVRTTAARIIAATNRDLKAMVEKGEFREDLYYRLNVFPIYIPPLRERKDDIPRLAYHFLKHFRRKTGKGPAGFTDDALQELIDYPWPGNVRQLRNAIERLAILSEGDSMDALSLLDNLQPGRTSPRDAVPDTVEELNEVKRRIIEKTFGRVQKAFLIKALKKAGGNITKAAEQVGMKRPNFKALMNKYGITADLAESRKP